MELLVFIIYGVVVAEWIFGNKTETAKGSTTITRGHTYYKISGILNMTIGMIGLLLVNLFLRGKYIIPEWSVWVGMIGFIFMMFMGMYNIYKMMASTN